MQAAGANIQLLHATSGERLLDSLPTLVEILGEEDAVATVVRNPTVLRLSSADMLSAFDVLQSVLGHADTVAAVGRNPKVSYADSSVGMPHVSKFLYWPLASTLTI